MEIVLAVLIGCIAGLLMDRGYLKQCHQYLAAPSTGQLHLAWTTRQLLRLVSVSASKRWYEAREHLKQSVFKSILCTLGLIYIVRLEFETNDDSRILFKTKIFHGFRRFEDLKVKIAETIPEVREELPGAQYWYQTFVAGRNVIDDFLNSYA